MWIGLSLQLFDSTAFINDLTLCDFTCYGCTDASSVQLQPGRHDREWVVRVLLLRRMSRARSLQLRSRGGH